jgi:hypothetical protein
VVPSLLPAPLLTLVLYVRSYDLGRDEFTGNATAAGGTISPITNRTFSTTSVYEAGFLPANSSEGINHGIATDGRVGEPLRSFRVCLSSSRIYAGRRKRGVKQRQTLTRVGWTSSNLDGQDHERRNCSEDVSPSPLSQGLDVI